jgi:hypothetical protein
MWAFVIVELDPFSDASFGLGSGFPGMQIDAFIPAAASSTHPSFDLLHPKFLVPDASLDPEVADKCASASI